jgi:uncharacterized protein YjbJ (UPF0337 family)
MTSFSQKEVSSMDESSQMTMEGKWDQMRGRVKESWGVLTDDELDRAEGKWDRVVGLIKEKSGESTDVIEKRLHELLDQL